MKTVGIVTYFKSYNYGVWLQAYATERFFEKEGFDAYIINYANRLENQTTKLAFKEKNRISGYFISFLKAIIFGRVTYYKKGFGNHLYDYYKLSSKEYTSSTDMKNLKYDILVAGSDQLWNPNRTYGKLDSAFLLQFGNCEKKISLSTSLGSDTVRETDKHIFTEAFRTFDAISVREEFAYEQLCDLTELPIKITVDPTFLLEKEEWIKLMKKSTINKIPSKYILTYFVSSNKRSTKYYSIIEKYARKLNIPILAIQFSRAKSTPYDKLIVGATIADFLYLLNNSTLMITDSFHGVALSINLEKEFVAIENVENPERVKHLLNELGLENRIDLDVDEYNTIDYKSVSEKVNCSRIDTKNWVLEAVKSTNIH